MFALRTVSLAAAPAALAVAMIGASHEPALADSWSSIHVKPACALPPLEPLPASTVPWATNIYDVKGFSGECGSVLPSDLAEVNTYLARQCSFIEGGYYCKGKPLGSKQINWIERGRLLKIYRAYSRCATNQWCWWRGPGSRSWVRAY
jgi:hypothetical protein